MLWVLIGVVVVGLILVVIVVGMYNKLVTLRNRYKNAFAQIDVQLKRRYDLIPNLVETAKGYLKHERETLEAVIAARIRPPQRARRPPPIRATRPPCDPWAAPKAPSPVPWDVYSPWSRPIPISRPTRTCWRSRRS